MSRYINSDITRYTPSCFCLILDQSSSMAEPYGERDGQLPVTKAEAFNSSHWMTRLWL